MEQYLEEKKALQKRPAAPFQRQDKKKAAYQTPQRPVAASSTQVPSQRSPGVKKECPHCGKTHGGSPARSANPSSGSSSSASYRKTRKASSPISSGRVKELLVAEELWNDHKKLLFFPFLSVATCTNHPLEIDQRIGASSGDLLRQEGTLVIRLHILGSGVLRGSSQKPEWRCFGGFLALPKESFNSHFDSFGGLAGDPTPLEDTAESDSERGE
ncbi:hypothetical protein Taro_020154 [Colocasia esculenta]|uniref:Uncharacterized protein n=1 Tax=Colocasia esculenta TaxID=4460 RepID=A0A843V1I3_COLES|nr:hypothetical protein [Colocasia esculenta]